MSPVTIEDTEHAASMQTVTTARRALSLSAAILLVTACRHQVPVETTPESRDTPARESIVLLMPLGERDAVRLLRRTFVQAGLLTAAQHTTERWVRVDLGAEWLDAAELREWQMFVRYDASPWGGTVLSLRAVEQRTSYYLEDEQLYPVNGRTRESSVSSHSRGQALAAWRNLEQIAKALLGAGGAPLEKNSRTTAASR